MSEPGMSPMPIRLQIISDLPQFGNNGLRPWYDFGLSAF
jgi:hypothetical protein